MGRAFFSIAVAMLATPAFAQTGATVPEPDAIALFALGVAGLVIGRYSSKKRPPRNDA